MLCKLTFIASLCELVSRPVVLLPLTPLCCSSLQYVGNWCLPGLLELALKIISRSLILFLPFFKKIGIWKNEASTVEFFKLWNQIFRGWKRWFSSLWNHITGCYGLNCVPPNFVCRSPNPRSSRCGYIWRQGF